MREIVHLQLGQCGNLIGNSFWELITDEHGLDKKGFIHKESSYRLLENLEVYYEQGRHGNFLPRALLIDLEPISLYANKTTFTDIFSENSIICGLNGTGNNWARGHFTDGPELLNPILDALRKECELCECFEGFQMVHSLGGGTGSGLGSLLLTKLRDEYPDRIITTYSVLPSPKIPESVVEPYNAILTLRELLAKCDQTFCIDNEALYNICRKTLSLSTPDFADMNDLASVVMSGVTTGTRFTGHTSLDLKKSLVTMIVFPKFHFFMPGFAPLSMRTGQPSVNFTVCQLMQQLFDVRNMLTACDPKRGKYFSAKAIFRMRSPMKEVDQEVMNVRNKNSDYFFEWLPQDLRVSVCDVVPKGLRMSVAFMGNSTSIHEVFQRISGQVKMMYNKKAFLHWYTGEGMDESEMEQAVHDIGELVSEYQQFQEAIYSDEISVSEDYDMYEFEEYI